MDWEYEIVYVNAVNPYFTNYGLPFVIPHGNVSYKMYLFHYLSFCVSEREEVHLSYTSNNFKLFVETKNNDKYDFMLT